MTTQQFDYIVIGSGIAGCTRRCWRWSMGACSSSPRGASRTAIRSTRRGASPPRWGRRTRRATIWPTRWRRELACATRTRPESSRSRDRRPSRSWCGSASSSTLRTARCRWGARRRIGCARAPRGGDATGARIELTLSSLAHHSRISVQEYVTTTRLLLDEQGCRVVGVAGLVGGTGAEVEFYARTRCWRPAARDGSIATPQTRRSPPATVSRRRTRPGGGHGHGVLPVPPHSAAAARRATVPDHGGHARRGRGAAERPRRRFHD